MDEFGDQRVLDFINKEFNGWALLQNADSVMPSTKTTIEKLVRLKIVDARPLFEVFASPDPKNPVRSVIKVGPIILPINDAVQSMFLNYVLFLSLNNLFGFTTSNTTTTQSSYIHTRTCS